MTATGTPPRAQGERGTRSMIAAAILLAVVGSVLTIWRPLAPELAAVPTTLDTFSPEVLATIDEYRGPRLVAATAGLALQVMVPVLIVLTPVGRRFVRRLAGPEPGRARRGAAVAAGIAVLTSLARFPLAVWIGYVHEGRWGFRTAGLALWLRDWVVGELLGWLGWALIGALLVWLIRRWPATWHWRGALGGIALAALFAGLYPLIVQPLFLPSRPVDDPRVEALIAPILAEAGMADVPVRIGDASTRTTRVNALVAGIGPTRRVVLFDTLLELPDEQVAFVVAHELAHREHLDIPRGVIGSAAGILVGAMVVRRALDAPRVRARVGARSPADARLVAVAAAVTVVLQLVGTPVVMLASRRAELAADARALEITDDPAALVRLARTFVVRDLARPEYEPWVRALWGSHPSPAERIRTAVAAAGLGASLPTLEALRDAEAVVRHPALGSGGAP